MTYYQRNKDKWKTSYKENRKERLKERREHKYDYSIIYIIECNISKLKYIGSTTSLLCERMAKHRYDNKKRLDRTESHLVMENNDYTYKVIEEYPCKTFEELRKREQYWIDKTECVNKQRAYNTNEDYKKNDMKSYYNNRDKRINSMKEKRDYQNSWGDPINKLNRDTPNNLLLIQPDIFNY